METRVAVAQTWDDLVFENRNKEYGAYSVRKRYSDRVIYALFICLGSVVMAVVTPTLIALVKGEETPITTIIKDPSDGIVFKKIDIVVDPPKLQQQPVQPRVRTVHPDAFPVVTTQAVVDDIKPATQPATDIDGSSELGDVDKPGDDIAIGDNTAGKGTDIGTGTTGIVLAPEVMPRFVGGESAMVRFVQRTIHYPASARRIGINGKVFVSFIIDRDGNITNAEVMRGLSAECDAEALRLVNKMPRWEPGRFNNMPVAVKMVLPIRFVVEQ